MREHLGPAMIYFTGNMYFNRALRHYCDKVRPSTYSLRTLICCVRERMDVTHGLNTCGTPGEHCRVKYRAIWPNRLYPGTTPNYA